MFTAILVIFAYVIILGFECIPLIKKKQIGEIILYSTLGISSMVLSVLLTLGVSLPSPTAPIRKFVEIIFGKQ